MADYAIVRTGGKQYRVEAGTRLQVEKLPAEAGGTVTLEEVLLVNRDGGLKIGKPRVEGASVVAKVLRQDRGPRLIVFKKRSKKTYKKWQGHRQWLTELQVQEIKG